MALRHGLRAWGPALLSAAAAFLAERNYRALPRLQDGAATNAGLVSIIIPARNEEDRLPRLLESLQHLEYEEREVIVVDDGSADATASLAESYGARVLRIDGPENGWTGKSYACSLGARQARGRWLLFTDADTVHAPCSLRRSVAHACAENAGLFSLLTRQQCLTFWERLLLPYAYALYFAGLVRANGATGTPVANGQYMLFRRDAYDRLGGHASVRDSIVEDVALAAAAQRWGIRTILARGEDAVTVRMYDSLGALWEGFSKNAFRFVTASPGAGLLTVAASMAFGAATPAALRSRSLPALVLPALGLIPWERRFGVPVHYAFLYGLAATVFGSIALDSMRRAMLGGSARWKGRVY